MIAWLHDAFVMTDLKMRPTILVAEVLMECLKPGGRFNDTVIEGYLRLIERRNQEGLHGFPTVLGLDTFYMKDLEDAMERVLHDLGRYAQSHDFECPHNHGFFMTHLPLALDNKTMWTVWCFSRGSRNDSPEGNQSKLNTLVWRVHMEEVLRTSRLGAFDGYLAECEELLDPDFLNAEAWDILECGVEDDTHRPCTEVPSRLELEYDAFMAELNEACDDYAEEVPANTISGISVDDRNLSLLIFDDENWLVILWEELQKELRASSADPPYLVPESPVAPIPTVTLTTIDPIQKFPTSYHNEIPNLVLNEPIRCSPCPSPRLSLIADEDWL
ncbi:hypothetical protein J6590_040091 [Homalodisca vitripennis]|nr:hypothetical protein J6590_040091 [Homalodisca vitripennis]